MSCNKLYYFVHLDAENRPIVDTMFAKSTAASNPCTTKIAPVTGLPMTAPDGNVACTKNPTGLRYWYQVKSIPTGAGASRNEIVPNSMIEVRGVPKPLSKNGTGGRPCQYIEFKVFSPIVPVQAPEPFVNLEAGV